MNFAKVIEAKSNTVQTGSLQDIIFKKLFHRQEDCVVIQGHIGERLVQIKLSELRSIVIELTKAIGEKSFSKGDTIMLLSTTATNELYTALWFAAFAACAVRVLLPVFPEANQFEHWIDETSVKAVFIPLQDISELKEYDRLKRITTDIERLCKKRDLKLYDQNKDFDIEIIINNAKQKSVENDQPLSLPTVEPETEAVIFSTSGTTGVTKLVTYTHGALYKNCLHWQEGGLYKEDLCNGSCFTPLFTHTIGVRSFINALWTGKPLCLITVDWFYKKPEVVRFFLLKMKPAHIVGGPAMFNTLIELYRQFPELKQELKQHLKCLISIGAPYNKQTAAAIKTVTGLNLLNAYGTTETQLATIALNAHSDSAALGDPLPGVSIALKKTSDENVYQLFIATPFQSINHKGQYEKDYFDTGDLVTYCSANNALYFAKRNQDDFLKDGYGIKIPLKELKSYYCRLHEYTTHIEWFPLNNKPGLAALIFLKNNSCSALNKQLNALIKNINDHLQDSLEPFEFTHRHLERYSLTHDEVPLTRKGTISKGIIYARYEKLIEDIKNPFVKYDKIEVAEAENKRALFKYVNPDLAELLEALKIDITYTKAKGDFLFYEEGGSVIKVTDFVGGFGSNLLGHNHPTIQKTLIQFIKDNHIALNNQGSVYELSSLLAQKLNFLFSKATNRLFKVQFANSGTEAVEIALHHAYYEWLQKIEKLRDQQLQLYGSTTSINAAQIWENNMQKILSVVPEILVINNCFHGFTSAARSLLNGKKRRTAFAGLLKPIPLFIDDKQVNWQDQIDTYLNGSSTTIDLIVREQGSDITKEYKVSKLIAAIFEPVMGEGGIHVVNTNVADYLAIQDFPLIADEIQCGLGRTGAIPAYKNAAYYLLGKSLGGGYEKIAAVLIDDNRFRNTFPQYFASTFANGNLAALAAITTVNIIHENNLQQKAIRKGKYITRKLNETAKKYPDVIAAVQGKGLMIGIHFNRSIGKGNNILRVLYEHELLGYLFSGWFLRNHAIRILPSLSAPNCLRLEPSFFISKKSIDQFCSSLETLCKICSQHELSKLLLFLINNDPYDDRKLKTWQGNLPSQLEEPAPGAIKVGFISNFTNPSSELKVIEPALEAVSETGLRVLFNKLQIILAGKPVKIISKNLLNGRVHFTFYLIPFDTAHLENISRWGKRSFYISKIQEAVDKLAEDGVTHVSLGAHASIITGNALSVASKNGIKIITGNTLTIASCLFHLDECIASIKKRHGITIKIAVVGASGNIGSGIVTCLCDEKYKGCDLIFVGNNIKRLQKLEEQSLFKNKAINTSSTTDLFQLKEADVIVCCTNTNDPIIFPHHLSAKPVYIVDISVPPALSEEAKNMDNVIFSKKASSVKLEQDAGLQISSHTAKGKLFCCAGEVILDGLYNTPFDLKGHVDAEAVKALYKMAETEGFFK